MYVYMRTCINDLDGLVGVAREDAQPQAPVRPLELLPCVGFLQNTCIYIKY